MYTQDQCTEPSKLNLYKDGDINIIQDLLGSFDGEGGWGVGGENIMFPSKKKKKFFFFLQKTSVGKMMLSYW